MDYGSAVWPVVVLALLTAPWSKIVGDEASHVYFGAVSILLAGQASAWIQVQAAVHAPDTVSTGFLQILPMLMFGEGFLNGALMSLVVAYKPRWVATFHDRWYLQGK